MLFRHQACPAWWEVSLVGGMLETAAPTLPPPRGSRTGPWERVLFAGPGRQAVEVDLGSLLGQEGILHPRMVLDFFEGGPIGWSQGQTPSNEMLTL